MIYIVDHQDSFTWNVVHQFSEFNDVYCSNYFDINKKMLDKADTIVLSPGPGSPKDYPSTSRLYNKYKGKKKMKFKVGRYHSLKLKEPFFSKNFEITMRCSKTNIAMAFENKIDDIYGFQFHPESFLTTNGKILIKKILSA